MSTDALPTDALPAEPSSLRATPSPARVSSPVGLHRVLEPSGEAVTLPQAALRLDARPEVWPDEVRISLDTLNLDAASYRQLAGKHATAAGVVDGEALRAEVLDIIAARGKMQNPVTGSGGMLIGTVDEVGPDSPLGLSVGDRVATLVSLSLTPLVVTDGLARWDGLGEQVPASGHAILFGRSIVAVLPDDLDPQLSLMIMDVCGAPALVARVVREHAAGSAAGAGPPGEAGSVGSPVEAGSVGSPVETRGQAGPTVCVLGAAGKSGSLSLAAAREAGAGRIIAVVPVEREAEALRGTGLADEVVLADARSPLGLSAAVESVGGPADVIVVCVDVPGCEQPAILATAQGGTIIFFSMATSFAAAALGAEGLAADVRMLVGNGYVPGHAAYALGLVRGNPAVRRLFEARLTH
ncbi:L-erythro-3,5-diaminohexanoate dehydrogenase [Lapillicoccus sp.]|uniref:L-erythro-3,5-diaminohexanoate dehydrogenase n=1 Tax=Lapillicoccus sp. TaxID=1909287 RepID=UPI0026002BB0|nr:L-erythro-3,5-diaminohexanoate dehydrogenase [Lapillicoccus sp.]